MRHHTLRILAVAVGISLAAVAMSASAQAASLREGSTGSGSEVTGSLPGQVLWGYYQTNSTIYGDGDSILRLINPNGAANANLANAQTQTVCAMIYVFDEEQEMGECCGCPLSSAQLATFSAYKNLTSNWALPIIGEEFFGGEFGSASNAYGSLAVVAAAPNAPACSHQSGACNGGCDPTNTPGYTVTNQSNLFGSITQLESQTSIDQRGTEVRIEYGPTNVKEVGLFDDAGGDPTNLVYLQEQCGALVGNGTEGGICNCPNEVPLTRLITD
jgi:hypothetical protein